MKEFQLYKKMNASKGSFAPTIWADSAWWGIKEIPGLTLGCFRTADPELHNGWVVMGFHHLSEEIEAVRVAGGRALDIVPAEQRLGYQIFSKLYKQTFTSRTEALRVIGTLADMESSAS